MKMIYHITHNDLDGCGCNILMNLYAGHYQATLLSTFVNYDTINSKVLDSIKHAESSLIDYIKKTDAPHPMRPIFEMWITDISISVDVAKELDDFKNRFPYWVEIILIDHHQTSLKLAEKYKWAHVDVYGNDGLQTCATYELLNHLIHRGLVVTQGIAVFANDVRDYDTYAFVHNGNKRSEQLNALQNILGYKEFVEFSIDRLFNDEILDLNGSIELQLLLDGSFDRRMEYLDSKTSNCIKVVLGSLTFVATFADQHISAIGDRLLKENPECDVAIIITLPNSISFITRKSGIDASEIASKFGGGGHQCASGAVINKSMLRKIIQQILKTKVETVREK